MDSYYVVDKQLALTLLNGYHSFAFIWLTIIRCKTFLLDTLLVDVS